MPEQEGDIRHVQQAIRDFMERLSHLADQQVVVLNQEEKEFFDSIITWETPNIGNAYGIKIFVSDYLTEEQDV